MKIIDAANLDYRAVNEALRGTDSDCTIEGLSLIHISEPTRP